jgi:hypothetical protein
MVLEEDRREAFIDFIRDQRLPAGIDAKSAEAACVFRRSKGFVLVDGKLYRRGARSGVLMKCVTKEDGYDILREIHEGVYGNHAASRTLVGKAYMWQNQPELYRLKYVSPFLRAPTCFKRYNPLACQVMSR